MELTIEEEWSDCCDRKYKFNSYTVYVDDHRILAVATEDTTTASKWLKDVQKSHNNKYGSLVVGVVADRQYDLFKDDNGPNSPYDILLLCVGSHSLLYRFPSKRYDDTPNLKSFQEFFSDSPVIAVGVDMASVAKNLENHHGIKVANPADLNKMAFKGMKRDDLDLANYDVDRLATAVLGQEYWIERPEKKVEWFLGRRYYNYRQFTEEKVMYGTFDTYFIFLIGSKLLEMLDGDFGTGSAKNCKKKKKKRGH